MIPDPPSQGEQERETVRNDKGGSQSLQLCPCEGKKKFPLVGRGVQRKEGGNGDLLRKKIAHALGQKRVELFLRKKPSSFR